MKRIITCLIAGSVAVAVLPAADASTSADRAEQRAERAIAPLRAQSTACFKATFNPRTRNVPSQYACVITVASAPGETCIVTVTVTERTRPRRVSAKVTIPLRCFATPAPPGQI
jgi:hypothetical protein